MKIFSWGSNSHGQLGKNSETEEIPVPTEIDFNINVKYITGGGKHTVLITSSDKVYTCGDNDKGQLGKELTVLSTKIFQPLSSPYKIVYVACGWDFNLALTRSGEVLGWGSNSFGQLGFSMKKTSYVSSPLNIIELKAVAVGAGLRHSAIVTSDGLVYTSGFGRKGQLGYCVKDEVPITNDNFQKVENLSSCLEVSCGECHCIARCSNGNFFAWGNNKFGQLGINPEVATSVSTPKKIDLNIKTINKNSLFSGWAHNLVLTDEGHLITWGRNDFGQLGEERKFNWCPQALKSLNKIKQVSVGSHHLIALTTSGNILTWGWNEHGNCGNQTCSNVLRPFEFKDFAKCHIVGSGAAHSFAGEMTACEGIDILEIREPNLKTIFRNSDLKEITIVDKNISYSEFFGSFLLSNRPCIVKNISEKWPCTLKWIKNKSLNVEYFKNNFRNTEVPISNCGKREYNVQKKCSMKLFEYLDYWEKYKELKATDCLYLKDWHLMKEYPNEEMYRVPPYFASDWLNEYYDRNPELNDDYRFVYIGPKGSWTPFHADVFTSYSWSVNISGRKRWILIPPGVEDEFRDSLGNLNYDIDLYKFSDQETKKSRQVFEVIQEEGQGLFVPSGWHHQVWNLEDTISVNHNWINGCNIQFVWNSLRKNLMDVMKEISDCREMENWTSQCQLILSASFGINYQFFYSFLIDIAKSRFTAIQEGKNIRVFGNWTLGENHMKFDLKQALTVLKALIEDENFLEISKTENNLSHSLELFHSLNNFVNF